MTRVLQIRRGSAAQNDNFTGMPGEITMDTDAKTLRVHDGETLGGFTLARANDAATNTGNFDIENVSDEFWANIVAQHAPAPFTVHETTPIQINSRVAGLNYILGDTEKPKFVQCALVCQNAEAGYAVGDEVWAFGVGNHANPIPNCEQNQNGMNLFLLTGCQKYWVRHHDTGVQTEITDENWCILFRVYY
ncbi:MAG: hypothetical protein IJY99_01405 [Alphaproteobacteria bacterium]|nr:hypothetical protein [Alphaproteobacteria bacterium]